MAIAKASARSFDDVRPAHERFAEHAAAHPEADAVLWPSGRISYGELDRAANAIAERLQAECGGAPNVVAVCAPASPEMAAGQLAAMKLGAAYLSLDPAHPFERLAHMVRDAGADVLLVMPKHAAHFPALPTVELQLDTRACGTPASAQVNADDTAYIIYTSGSTGHPKGVAVPHRGLATFALGIKTLSA
jgi:non-ribosomal peptide synthetase component F